MPFRTPGSIEYAVIAAFLVLLVVIGLLFRRFNRNASDYFRSGSQGTWWLVGTSAFMSSVSAVTFTGYGGAAFKAGWSISAVYLGNVVGLAIQAVILAPWFRQLRATTFPEVVRERFGPVTAQFYAYTKLVTFTLYASLWLFGLAVFSASTLGLPLHTLIPILGGVALFYPLLGGKWAVMAADFVKGLIMMTVTVFLSIFCLRAVGGFHGLEGLIQQRGLQSTFRFFKQPGELPGDLYTWPWALAVFLISVIVNCGMSNAVKFFAVKDGREARLAAGLGALLMLAGVIFWFIPPMTARLLFEQQVLSSGLAKPEEASIAIVSARLLPAGLVGMMVVAMFSATMSAMDVGINGNAAIFTKDVLPALARLAGKDLPSDQAQLRLGKISTLGFGFLIILLAEHFSRQRGAGILDLVLNVGGAIGVPLTIPTVLCLFIRRVPSWSALFSVAMASLPSVATLFAPDWLNFQTRTLWTVALGTGAFLLTTLFWRMSSSEYQQRTNGFFTRMHRPVDFESEVGMNTDRRQLIMIGSLSTTVAGFVLLLLFIPNPLAGRLAILTLALVIGIVGTLLLFAGNKTTSPDRNRSK